jgi:drug/metabolite transporter (DMT)-like permease
MITAMTIFGTIGLFVRWIPLPSAMIALARGFIGMLFLIVVMAVRKTPLSRQALRKNFFWLLISGGLLGFNWILLFESYRYTSVAVGTLCYYMAPILIILASPVILREKLTVKKVLCVLASLGGMVCISGVLSEGVPSAGELKGILLGLIAAVLYAAIVLCNKQIHEISAYEKTIFQLGISVLAMIPYCVLTVSPDTLTFSPRVVFLLILVGILNTGVTYYLYFGSMEYLSGQSVAVISYIDPVIAVLLSVLILREPMHLTEGIGAVLILGAAVTSELGE